MIHIDFDQFAIRLVLRQEHTELLRNADKKIFYHHCYPCTEYNDVIKGNIVMINQNFTLKSINLIQSFSPTIITAKLYFILFLKFILLIAIPKSLPFL